MAAGIATALSAAALLVPAVSSAAGAISNGSFETGTAPGAYLELYAGNISDIADWTVDSGSVDYVGSYWLASDGANSIDLNGTTTGSVSQTFATSVGTTYDVTFDLSGNPDSRPVGDPFYSPSVKDVQVSATGGSPADYTFDTSAMGNSLGNMMWQAKTYSFTATAANTTLTFASQIPGAFGPAIDNVSVTAQTPACSGSGDTTFDTFALGSVNGQGGWGSTGAYDQDVVANTYGFPTFGCKSLRISNAVTSGSFGDQTFSYSVPNEAGETDALSGGYSGGTRQNHFDAQFDIASTMLDEQPGLVLSVSPDRGDGARMSYVRFEDSASGINVFFDDVQGTSNPANFVETQIAGGAAATPALSRTAPHTIKFSMDFVDGPSNDVVQVYIDGVLVHTGTSWENYYRFDPESNPSLVSNSRTVDSLIFRAGGSSVPANSGKGFLFDNVSLSSSTVPPAAAPVCPAGTVQSATPVDTVSVNSAQSTPTVGATALTNGATYLLVASGDWQNSLNRADAEYTSLDSWTTHMDGYDVIPYFLGLDEFDLEVNGAFINWGAYDSGHQYSHLYTGTGAPVSLMVFDGDSHGGPANVNAGWYGDNVGSLSVNVYSCTVPPPPVPPANACDTPTVAPAGYTLRNGTTGNDTVTLAPNTMFVGKGGNDRVTAPDGNYIICTGSGNDAITVGNGNDAINAGGGNNTVKTGDGQGSISTADGNDTITTGDGARTINAGGGNNSIRTGDGDQTVTTGSGNDTITTGGGDDTINAGGGNNSVNAGGGNDAITTGSGNDTVNGGAGTDSCSLGGGMNHATSCP
ncbi:MAG TPA: choice-of-anchor C family protein [Candidatus Paceibacterota bacterium]|nr:choice-of-anchor C family protein [Candidatus Paceibacterota bacterium]